VLALALSRCWIAPSVANARASATAVPFLCARRRALLTIGDFPHRDCQQCCTACTGVGGVAPCAPSASAVNPPDGAARRSTWCCRALAAGTGCRLQTLWAQPSDAAGAAFRQLLVLPSDATANPTGRRDHGKTSDPGGCSIPTQDRHQRFPLPRRVSCWALPRPCSPLWAPVVAQREAIGRTYRLSVNCTDHRCGSPRASACLYRPIARAFPSAVSGRLPVLSRDPKSRFSRHVYARLKARFRRPRRRAPPCDRDIGEVQTFSGAFAGVPETVARPMNTPTISANARRRRARTPKFSRRNRTLSRTTDGAVAEKVGARSNKLPSDEV
jgi:hypothetical protein